jgi:Domain of unknown function (DUF397)
MKDLVSAPEKYTLINLKEAKWRKSSLSNSQGNCVEIAHVDDHVAVRDSKNRQGGVLVFTPDEWKAFIGGVRKGEFDNSL